MQISLLIQIIFHWRKQYYGWWTRIMSSQNGLKHLIVGFVSYKHAAFHFSRC